MKMKLYVFQAILLLGFSANAGICSYLLTRNPLLKLTIKSKLSGIKATVQSKQGKLSIAGEVFNSIGDIKSYLENSVANDNLPFIITSKGKLVISSRINEQTFSSHLPAQFSAHSSLVNKLHSVDSYDYPVAAGEVRKRNNKVFLISNKAGTYRGEAKTLDFIKKYFDKVGVQAQTQIEYRDYSQHQYEGDHLTDRKYAQNAYDLMTNPKSKRLMSGITQAYKDYYLLFPNQEKPGFIDTVKMMELVEELERNMNIDLAYKIRMSVIAYLEVYNNESLYFYTDMNKLLEIHDNFTYVRNVMAAWKVMGRI